LHFPLSRRRIFAHVTTLHGRLDLLELQPLYTEFHDMPLVSISRSQRKPLPQARWVSTVLHGLPIDLYSLGNGQGGYLAFLGRISPEKRVDRAIEIAIRAGTPLRVAAKVDRADEHYFATKIKPLFKRAGSLVEFVGEIGDKDKQEFLGNAKALLFPIDWPEPFGLVMIEAMACGTPVIAFPCGSVPEVIDDGLTGCIVSSIEGATSAVARLDSFDRQRCRQTFERRFSAARMAHDYRKVYRQLVDSDSNRDQREAPTVIRLADEVEKSRTSLSRPNERQSS
jgi:glycosyltransferase involved in cell wall biosynthesis